MTRNQHHLIAHDPIAPLLRRLDLVGGYSDGMDAPDIYQDAALAEITLVCSRCNAALDSEDLPQGEPRFPESGYFLALANEAYRLGWLIEYDGANARYFDYRILCPLCAKQEPT